MSRMNGKKTHTHRERECVPFVAFDQMFSYQVSLIPPWEDQCEWHKMTRMTRPDCAVMCNLINTHTHTHSSSTTYSYILILVRIDTYIMVFLGTTETTTATVCVSCVFFPFILDIKFVGRTSRGHTGGRSHRISHPPSFCGACLSFSREKGSAVPFPRRAFLFLFIVIF